MPGSGTTTVPDVKAACVAVLEPAMAALEPFNGSTPAVSYGFPGESELSAEAVFIGGGELDDDWAALGRGSRQENYTLDLVINVLRSGATQQEVTERAFAILRAADAVLTAGEDLVQRPGWVLVKFRRLVERPGDSAREAEITAGIRVFAQIT